MEVNIQFKGQEKPFEGDRTFRLKTLPAGARVTSARVKLRPQKCVETITFDKTGAGSWGATKEKHVVGDTSTSSSEPPPPPPPPTVVVTVDFHARRTANQLNTVTNAVSGTKVQVDMGGIWMPLAQDGTIVGTGTAGPLVLSSTSIEHPIPLVSVQRIQLRKPGSNTLDLQSVQIQSLPSNLTLRLGETPPFWARPGELASEESSSDFAEILQAFLAEAEVKNGYYDLPLVVHSDTIACLDLEVVIEYVSQQNVLPDGVNETTIPYTHNGLPEADADLLQIAVPAGARINAEQSTAVVTGAFQPSRVVYGPTGEVAEAAAIPVTSVQSQAQPIKLAETVAATAVDLRLALDPDSATAVVSLNILADSDGKPADEPLLSQPVTLSLDRDTAVKPTWISAELPSEFQFEEGERYWLVLHAAAGSVFWSGEGAAAGATGMQFTDNGGLSWRLTNTPKLDGPLAGYFRLRHTPDRFQMPIELQVGSGEQAARVSLDRFQPMGRVEFDLGFDEVADAINSYLEKENTAACPAGEHLANGRFKKWTFTGNVLANPQEVDLSDDPICPAVAVAPDGSHLLTIQSHSNSDRLETQLLSIDIPCHENEETIELSNIALNTSSGDRASIALNTDGSRAYVLTRDQDIWSLYVVDRIAKQTLGVLNLQLDNLQLDGPSADYCYGMLCGMAITPDGKRLYLLRKQSVQVIDTDKLDQELLSNSGSAALDAVKIDEPDPTIPDLGGYIPTGLALSPDGARLYVTIWNEAGIDLYIYDVRTHEELEGSPVHVGGNSISISPSPDGRWILVPNRSGDTVSVIDAGRLSVVRTIQLPSTDEKSGFRPGAVVFSPDSKRAFVASLSTRMIAIVDPNRSNYVNVIDEEREYDQVHNLAITPEGDRLYAFVYDSYISSRRLVTVPIGLQLPDEWLVTSGSVIRERCESPFHPAAILGLSAVTNDLDTRQSSLSQVVPVTDSCTYDFSFLGKATAQGTVAEVIWRSDACGSVRTDQVPVAAFTEEPQSAEQTLTAFELHRRRLIAPEGATQAEVRFTTPSGIAAAIDQVSLAGTREILLNGDLQEDPEGQLSGWGQSATSGAGIDVDIAEEGAVLQNLSIVPASLIQTIAVPSGEPYTLSFHGRVTNQPDAEKSARLEVTWLAEDGTAVGSKTTLEIPADGPDRLAASGTVPANAGEAEIQLVLPGSASLTVQEISFKPLELIQVPLTFIAQVPGELKVSDIRVAFDEASPTLPPIPESGLCTPTTPGRQPGEGDGCCYCPCCGGDDPLLDPQPVTTATGRPAVSGECPNCSANIVQPGGTESAARAAAQPVTARRSAYRTARMPIRSGAATYAMAPETPIDDVAAGTPDPFELPPLTAIDGIGPKRALHLATIEIEDMSHLAGADPVEIADLLQGVTVTTAEAMIAEAQEIMVALENE